MVCILHRFYRHVDGHNPPILHSLNIDLRRVVRIQNSWLYATVFLSGSALEKMPPSPDLFVASNRRKTSKVLQNAKRYDFYSLHSREEVVFSDRHVSYGMRTKHDSDLRFMC